MKVRIKFSADLYIEAENLKEVNDKFSFTPLLSDEAREKLGAEFSDILLVENADTHEDLLNKFCQL